MHVFSCLPACAFACPCVCLCPAVFLCAFVCVHKHLCLDPVLILGGCESVSFQCFDNCHLFTGREMLSRNVFLIEESVFFHVF